MKKVILLCLMSLSYSGAFSATFSNPMEIVKEKKIDVVYNFVQTVDYDINVVLTDANQDFVVVTIVKNEVVHFFDDVSQFRFEYVFHLMDYENYSSGTLVQNIKRLSTNQTDNSSNKFDKPRIQYLK